MKLCSITPGLTGQFVLRWYETDHTAGSGKKSFAVTAPFETSLSLALSSHDGRSLPRRRRLMVERSALTLEATSSSVSPADVIHSSSFMESNVRQAHGACQALRAPDAVDLGSVCAHHAHMARPQRKSEPVEVEAPPTLPTFIKAWRKKAKKTQEQAGAAIGKDRTTIGRYETGQIAYSPAVLEGLAALYGCTPGDLLDRDPFDPAVATLDLLRRLEPWQLDMLQRQIKGLIGESAA